MAALLPSVRDEVGQPRVDGFGDDAQPIANAMRVATATLPFDEAARFEGCGGMPGGDPADTVREWTTLRPTIEINGLLGGYTGAGTKNVLPAEAPTKITMRLAPAWTRRLRPTGSFVCCPSVMADAVGRCC